MKNNNRFISFNNNAPTAWNTLIVLIAAMAIFATYTYVCAQEIKYVATQSEVEEARSEEKEARKEVQIITTAEFAVQEEKRAILAELRECESNGYNLASGDNGASNGPFQWQKPTFEDKIGREVSYSYYYEYVTDYERIYKLTEETFFDDGEWWRWENCSYKIGYVST